MKKNLFTFLVIAFLSIAERSSAQWYNAGKVNKNASAVFETAYSEAVAGKYDASVAHLDEALAIDPKFVDAWLAKADIFSKMKKYPAAVSSYETAYTLDSMYSRESYLSYSIALAGTGNFEKALTAVNKFLSLQRIGEQSVKAGNARKKNYEFAIQFAKDHPAGNYVFNPQNMGDSINTNDLEYLPSLTVDGNKMIFNRRINGDEDFYESNRINGVWQKAKPIAGRLNTNFNEGAENISQDGQWLIFTGCNYPEGLGSCDLYISYKDEKGEWQEAENLGNVINDDSWESAPSLSPDKRDLYFSSNRSGGFGGSDIWVSHRNEQGQWGKPQNLGPVINTSGDEGFAFVHADNSTLYFNSAGHPGYGAADLFVSRRNEKGEWQTPQNLGYPINTIDEESSMIVSSDGRTAYYASDKGDYKRGIDLYTFELPENDRASKTLWVKGKIYDKKTNRGISGSVELSTINPAFVLSKLQTDADGNYLTTLPEGKDYAFTVNKKGYLFYSENFSMKGNMNDSPMVVNIALQPIEAGASIVLKNIFFESKKAELQSASYAELDKLVILMNDNPKMSILVSGYTDNVGKPADNLLLSQNRAKAVTGYLTFKGIDPKRLTGKGFGETKPVSDNNSEEGRAKNRRTEITVVSN